MFLRILFSTYSIHQASKFDPATWEHVSHKDREPLNTKVLLCFWLPVLNGGGAHFRFFFGGGGIAIPSFDKLIRRLLSSQLMLFSFVHIFRKKALGKKLSSIKYQP